MILPVFWGQVGFRGGCPLRDMMSTSGHEALGTTQALDTEQLIFGSTVQSPGCESASGAFGSCGSNACLRLHAIGCGKQAPALATLCMLGHIV